MSKQNKRRRRSSAGLKVLKVKMVIAAGSSHLVSVNKGFRGSGGGVSDEVRGVWREEVSTTLHCVWMGVMEVKVLRLMSLRCCC